MLKVQPSQGEVWLVDGHKEACFTRDEAALLAIGSLETASAHWYANFQNSPETDCIMQCLLPTLILVPGDGTRP
jgi:hypothetical protein